MDIDDQLQMLQRELMQVQQQKTNPLSQRTVAQIMIKLHQQGFKFFPTTDANQYVTPNKIDQEIIQFVQERGRVKIGLLPQILNLNQDLIQSRINLVCQKSTHVRNNENLLSREYLRNFTHTIKQKLEIDGIVELDDVALTYEFNMAFLIKIINQNLQDLDAEMSGNQLITRQYRRMKKRRILGFLLAVNRPINIETAMKSAKLTDPKIQNLIQELISEGKLKGRCQSSYYIPDKFSKNQKEMVQKFFQNNGYIDYSMLQKNFQVSKPEQWVKKNLKGQYVVFEEVCFNKSKLESFQTQIQSLLRGEGFFQIATVIPFQLDTEKMEKFLTQICNIKDFVLDEGMCYSEEWLTKCVNQFRDKVIFDIFLKQKQPKGKKKGGKKQKQKMLNEQQIIQTLFDAGLAEYSVAQGLAESILPLISQRLDGLKTQMQKQLTKNNGVISNAFLKYKKCKTIIKTMENLQRILNTIQKNKKKGTEWTDTDFGPSQTNPQGKFSLVYYDGITPKQWPNSPNLESIRWVKMSSRQILNWDGQSSRYMQKSNLINLLEILDNYNSNKAENSKIPTPNIFKIPSTIKEGEEQVTAPFVFRFFVGDKQSRYVLVDGLISFANEERVSNLGLNGLIQKAYAKLRYCYKGVLNVGIVQMLFQLTGLNIIKIATESEKDEDKAVEELTQKNIVNQNLVIVMGEGVTGKKLKLQGEQTQFRCMKPYFLSSVEGEQTSFKIQPKEAVLEAKTIVKLFKNLYVIQKK